MAASVREATWVGVFWGFFQCWLLVLHGYLHTPCEVKWYFRNF